MLPALIATALPPASVSPRCVAVGSRNRPIIGPATAGRPSKSRSPIQKVAPASDQPNGDQMLP